MAMPGQSMTSENITRHLVSVSSAVRQRITDGLVERGLTPSLAVTQLIPNLPPEGLGMSALAERAGLSLQRAGQLVQQLEDDDFVRRVTDPSDRRARRVVYTERGEKLLAAVDELVAEVLDELEGILGKRRFQTLRRDLATLDAALGGSTESLRVARNR